MSVISNSVVCQLYKVIAGVISFLTHSFSKCAISGIDRPTTIANDSFEVLKYQWKTGAPQEETDRQCVCGLQLILQLNNGDMSSSLCTKESPIDSSSFCEAESFNETNCQSYVNSSCEFSCIIKYRNGTVVTLIADLGCDVLRRFTQDICPNLFRMYTIQHMHGNAIMCDMFLTIDISHLESLNTTTLVPTLLDYSGGNEEVTLSVGLTLGVVGTTIVAVIVCCMWYACHRRRYEHKSHSCITQQKLLTLVFIILPSVHN